MYWFNCIAVLICLNDRWVRKYKNFSWFTTALETTKMNFVDIIGIESVKAVNSMKCSREKEVCIFYLLTATRFHPCSLKSFPIVFSKNYGKKGAGSFLCFDRVPCSSIRFIYSVFRVASAQSLFSRKFITWCGRSISNVNISAGIFYQQLSCLTKWTRSGRCSLFGFPLAMPP